MPTSPAAPSGSRPCPAAAKAQLITATGRASLCVQSEAPPYRYVTVEGPTTQTGRPPDEAWTRALHHRYLGPEAGDKVYEMMAEMLTGEVLVELQPEHWTSSDYSQDFAAFS